MRAGSAALCRGTVFHERLVPTHHQFTSSVDQVWIDPDHPEDLCGKHRFWSARRPAPIRFKRTDYGATATGGTAPAGSLADAARHELTSVLGYRPTGAVRLLTQLRRWGWLFNPISVFVVWHTDPDTPVGVVLEVTNTPWKERHRYPVALKRSSRGFESVFPKELHVSPFLDTDFTYELRLADRDDRFALDLDVVRPEAADPVVHTALRVGRLPPESAMMTDAILQGFLSTRQVSAGIHIQAVHLFRKGVPFVKHPKRRAKSPKAKPPKAASQENQLPA